MPLYFNIVLLRIIQFRPLPIPSPSNLVAFCEKGSIYLFAYTFLQTWEVMDAGNFEGLFYNKQKMGKEKTLKREAMVEYDDDDGDNDGNDDSDNSEEEKMKVSTFSSVAGKKGSNGGGGSGIRCCQAEKCAADLTDAKPYYRRHKVCQLHAKSQVVLVAGICKRFCQQCSRFHELAEFDDTKRSCRRRLAGHNERRRKAPGEPNASTQLKGTAFRKIDDGARIRLPVHENASQPFSDQIR